MLLFSCASANVFKWRSRELSDLWEDYIQNVLRFDPCLGRLNVIPLAGVVITSSSDYSFKLLDLTWVLSGFVLIIIYTVFNVVHVRSLGCLWWCHNDDSTLVLNFFVSTKTNRFLTTKYKTKNNKIGLASLWCMFVASSLVRMNMQGLKCFSGVVYALIQGFSPHKPVLGKKTPRWTSWYSESFTNHSTIGQKQFSASYQSRVVYLTGLVFMKHQNELCVCTKHAKIWPLYYKSLASLHVRIGFTALFNVAGVKTRKRCCQRLGAGIILLPW